LCWGVVFGKGYMTGQDSKDFGRAPMPLVELDRILVRLEPKVRELDPDSLKDGARFMFEDDILKVLANHSEVINLAASAHQGAQNNLMETKIKLVQTRKSLLDKMKELDEAKKRVSRAKELLPTISARISELEETKETNKKEIAEWDTIKTSKVEKSLTRIRAVDRIKHNILTLNFVKQTLKIVKATEKNLGSLGNNWTQRIDDLLLEVENLKTQLKQQKLQTPVSEKSAEVKAQNTTPDPKSQIQSHIPSSFEGVSKTTQLKQPALGTPDPKSHIPTSSEGVSKTAQVKQHALGTPDPKSHIPTSSEGVSKTAQVKQHALGTPDPKSHIPTSSEGVSKTAQVKQHALGTPDPKSHIPTSSEGMSKTAQVKQHALGVGKVLTPMLATPNPKTKALSKQKLKNTVTTVSETPKRKNLAPQPSFDEISLSSESDSEMKTHEEEMVGKWWQVFTTADGTSFEYVYCSRWEKKKDPRYHLLHRVSRQAEEKQRVKCKMCADGTLEFPGLSKGGVYAPPASWDGDNVNWSDIEPPGKIKNLNEKYEDLLASLKSKKRKKRKKQDKEKKRKHDHPERSNKQRRKSELPECSGVEDSAKKRAWDNHVSGIREQAKQRLRSASSSHVRSLTTDQQRLLQRAAVTLENKIYEATFEAGNPMSKHTESKYSAAIKNCETKFQQSENEFTVPTESGTSETFTLEQLF